LLLFALILLTLSQQNLQQLEDLESHANDVLDVASIFAKNSEDTESTATLAVPQTIYTPYAQPGQVLVTQPPADTFYGIPSAFVGMMVGFVVGIALIAGLLAFTIVPSEYYRRQNTV